MVERKKLSHFLLHFLSSLPHFTSMPQHKRVHVCVHVHAHTHKLWTELLIQDDFLLPRAITFSQVFVDQKHPFLLYLVNSQSPKKIQLKHYLYYETFLTSSCGLQGFSSMLREPHKYTSFNMVTLLKLFPWSSSPYYISQKQ